MEYSLKILQKKDFKKIKHSNLQENFQKVIQTLQENPFE
jgi:Txe/YoeB family toxin of Txe-Axe toxin-antitoxin module